MKGKIDRFEVIVTVMKQRLPVNISEFDLLFNNKCLLTIAKKIIIFTESIYLFNNAMIRDKTDLNA